MMCLQYPGRSMESLLLVSRLFPVCGSMNADCARAMTSASWYWELSFSSSCHRRRLAATQRLSTRTKSTSVEVKLRVRRGSGEEKLTVPK